MEITSNDLIELIRNNSSIILENNNPDQSKEYGSLLKKVLSDQKSNLGFIFTFGTAITAFFPIVESFIKSSGTNIDFDIKLTVINLTICAVAIALKEPKESYKNLFEDLRLQGTYGLLKPVVAILNIFRKIFSKISEKTGKIVNDIVDMFAYTALFVPFALVISDLIFTHSITMDGFISALTGDWLGKLMSFGVSFGTIGAKHFTIDLINKLKSFNPLKFSNIKKVIDKIKKYTVGQIFGDGNKNDREVQTDIKKYADFEGDEIINEIGIKENKYVELDGDWGSLGEYVEKIEKAINKDVDKKTEFIRILGKHLDSKTDIRVSNAIDLLPEYDQRLLVKELEETFLVKESVADEFMDDIKDITLSGKGGFNSFLKVITALNLPEIKADIDNCPKEFSIIYSMNSLNKERLLSTLQRFRSLSSGVRILQNVDDSIIGIYFGLKYDGGRFYIEYGVLADDKRYVVGEFKFGSPQYRKMMEDKNKVLKPFQDEMKEVDLKDLKLLMKIKGDFTNFSPGYFHRKSNSMIKDNVLIQGYYGVGNWVDGTLDKESYDSLKNEFKEWVLTQKWKDKVLVNIKPGKFWVYFRIKMN